MDRVETSPRRRHLEEIADGLPQRASALTQLFLTRSTVCVSRTEVGVLRQLASGPRRISELAADEHVSQPAITLLVNRLQERGWVLRAADPRDGRAVLVRLAAAGEEALARLREEYRVLLHEEMTALDDRELQTLADAVRILDELIDRMVDRGR